jgi:uncharacterized membrane protein YozB (DUF420 family)
MILGFIFARRNLHRPYHKWVMTLITILNWFFIIFLMIVAYRFDVARDFSQNPANTRYLLPTIHAVFGVPAQLLATYIIYRMFREDAQVARAKQRGETNLSKYWFKSAKPIMRLTLALWLITATLGIFSYLTRYNIIPAYMVGEGVAAPVATPEVDPMATNEVVPPAATDEVETVSTPELDPVETPEIMPPAATDELEPISTPEPPTETEEPED